VVLIVVSALAAGVLASCGGGESGGAKTLNLWVFNEPSGSFKAAVDRCSAQSNGRYKIVYNTLSNDADQQRQQLVRRLAAKDSSIDIAGLDVVWTAEFAEAGWIKPWPAAQAAAVRRGTLPGPLATATYQRRLWAAPANTNTQLLWYRKDKVKTPAKTWDGLIDQAVRLKTRVVTMGAQYEGTTVWFNSLNAAAGGTIIEGERVTLGAPGGVAARIMKRLATSPAGDPGMSAMKEDQVRLAFESGSAFFEVNYPFIYPSAKESAPDVFKNIAWAPYPSVKAGGPNKAPIGGINWGVGGYTKHPAEAFAAAACLRNRENQMKAAIDGGLPPTINDLYDDPELLKVYPFGKLIRDQVATGAVRPVTPAYSDVSLAIYKSTSPAADIKLDGFVPDLRSKLEDALESKGLF
jgi:multiple sugar transport system substrate-binding protein